MKESMQILNELNMEYEFNTPDRSKDFKGLALSLNEVQIVQHDLEIGILLEDIIKLIVSKNVNLKLYLKSFKYKHPRVFYNLNVSDDCELTSDQFAKLHIIRKVLSK